MTRIPDPYDIDWNVTVEGRGWREEAMQRYELTPEKIEMMDGMLFGSEAQRLRMLGLLLENCGAEAAVRYGDPEVWRRVVAGLDDMAIGFTLRVKAMLRQWDDVGTCDDAAAFYAKWALPGYAERRDGVEKSAEEIATSYPKETSWRDWTYYHSRLDGLQLRGDQAAATVLRDATSQAVGQDNLVAITRFTERWQLRWRDQNGWQIAAATLLARSERMSE